MSIDMYLATARTQATGAATMGKSHTQGYEALQKAAQNFANDTALQADTYTSAKGMFGSVILPLIQAGQLLSESVAEACQKFPEEYVAQVDSGDLKSSELEEKIQRLNSEIQSLYAIRSSIEARDTADNMKIRQLNSNRTAIAGHEAAKKKLEEQLQKLMDFHASSPSLFSEITTLTNAVNQGSAIAGRSWHAASGTFKMPEGTDMSWTKDVNNRWENRQFAKKYDVERPKDMNAKDYQEYLKTLREQKQVLCKEDGWDEEAFKAYMEHVNKKLGSGGKNVFDRLNQINVETRLVGSGIYEMMFDAADMTEREKVQLVLKQMGAAIDENNMLQLQGTHKFDPKMPPHSKFLEKFAEVVVGAYENGLVPSNNPNVSIDELTKIHQFRMYIDKQNIEYIRANYSGTTDLEKLLNYGKENNLKFDETSRLHNRYSKEYPFLKQTNDKIKTENGLSEFIINVETGDFVTQWDVLGIDSAGKATIQIDGYSPDSLYAKEIVETESFNYSNDKDLHGLFDVDPAGADKGLEHGIKVGAKDEWKSETWKNDGGKYGELYEKLEDYPSFKKGK